MNVDNCPQDTNNPLLKPPTSPPFSNPHDTNNEAFRVQFVNELNTFVRDGFNDLVNKKRDFLEKKNLCKSKTITTEFTLKTNRRFCICPICLIENIVFDKSSGKNYYTLPFSNVKLPNPLAYVGFFSTPRPFDLNQRNGAKSCGACGGTKKLFDPYDDTAKYAKVAVQVQQKAEKLMEQEAKLGLGGSRTSLIQGSDTLFVGLGFNDNKSYEILPDATIAPSIRGGKIPQQNAVKVNAVKGIQAGIAWPQQIGNYTIKCANKFNALVGSGGLTMATTGPLTFSGGKTKITAPEIQIGCSSGPLTMEGDSVNITGRTISLTPTNGELFVKGSINNTANTTCMGHSHSETASFVKAACVGTTRSTYSTLANPDVLQTSAPAWWYNAVNGAALDLVARSTVTGADLKTAAYRFATPLVMMDLQQRMQSFSRLPLPFDKPLGDSSAGTPPGHILPGTRVYMIGNLNGSFQGTGAITGDFPCNFYGPARGTGSGAMVAFGTYTGQWSGYTINPIRVYLEPHVHQIPMMMHKHEMRVPDIDTSSDDAETLRSRIITDAQESGLPHDPLEDSTTRMIESSRSATEGGVARILEKIQSSHASATVTKGTSGPRVFGFQPW
jgi:hypothetical protein